MAPDLDPEQAPLPISAQAAATDATALEAALAWAFDEPDPQRLRRTRAVVVVHRGEIVAERYAPGFTANTPLPGWSMTKTAAAALTGILVADKRLALDSRALLNEWRGPGDRRAQITLAHLLRMTDGLEFNEQYDDPLSDVAVMLLGTGDASGFALRKPLATAPSTSWRYSSGTTNVLAGVLRRTLDGRDLSDLVRRRLFDRLGMRHAVLEPDAAGTPVLSSFMHATAREWAAFGQFLLQDGVWHGERLLPSGWVDYMRTPTPQCARGDFGAHLWLKVPQGFGGARGRGRSPARGRLPSLGTRGASSQRRAEPRAGGGAPGPVAPAAHLGSRRVPRSRAEGLSTPLATAENTAFTAKDAKKNSSTTEDTEEHRGNQEQLRDPSKRRSNH